MACFTIITLNALSFLEAYKNTVFFNVIRKSDMIFADGLGAVWGYRQLFQIEPERITGIDFIDEICKLCAKHRQAVYLAGSKQGVARDAGRQLKRRYPGLIIAGTESGFWKPEEEPALINRINRSGAAVLLLALGQPAQELFLMNYKDQLKTRLAMGVGGSFDVIAGRLKRAPQWMQQSGLEWLYRMVQEPKRVGSLFRLIHYVWLVGRAKIRG